MSNDFDPRKASEGKDKDFAFNKIEEYGLSLGEIVYVYSNKYPKDKIICANFIGILRSSV